VRRTAALIVGGGPAGSAAAIMLGRAGLAAELIERTSGPRDVVCGGFLGWDALGALDRLGIDAWALGARPIGRVRLIGAERLVEARLPHRAAGLSRRTLDEALIGAAARAGALVRRGVAVRAADGARRVRLDTGETIEAEALLLATGKHEMRGLARPREAAATDPVVGFRTALAPSVALQKALEGVIELHLFDGGYAGLLLQEDGSANLCVSIARDRIGRAGGIGELIAQLSEKLPGLGQRMHNAEAGEWQAVAGIPYGWRAGGTAPGLFRLGDQGAVIASLAGDGIAIALASGMEAAAALLRHGPRGAEAFQAGFAARARRPLAVASKLRHAAENGRTRRLLMRLLRWAPFLLSVGARLTRFGK
jgi:menaquinone-9 beta-reductase